MSSTGIRIREIRKINALSQPAFAYRIKISSGYISEIEQGNKKPSAEILEYIRMEFGLTANWLMTGKGWANEPGSALQAIDEVAKFKKLLVQKVVVVTYESRFGAEQGFLIYTSYGLYSISGSATRTEHLGGGRNCYCDILKIFDDQRYSVFKCEIVEDVDWQKIDLGKYVNGLKLEKLDISQELHNMKPDVYPVSSGAYSPDEDDKLGELIKIVKEDPRKLDRALTAVRKPHR